MPKKHFETPHILHDLPLDQRDTANFHFDEFAATLARLIADKSTRTPLTIGIAARGARARPHSCVVSSSNWTKRWCCSMLANRQ